MLALALVPALGHAQATSRQAKGGRTVASITIFGNHVTKEYVLLRELNINVGDPYDPTAVSDARERLEGLAIIAYADIQEKWANPREVHLVIQVEEKKCFSIAPTCDYERRYGGFIIGLDLLLRNVRGRNESVRFSTGWGVFHGYRLRWSNPHILGPVKLGIYAGASWERYDFEYLPLRLADWELAAGAWRDIAPWLRFETSYHWRELDVDEAKDPWADSATKDPAFVFALSHDSRDLRYYPARGIFARASLRLAGVGRTQSYRIYEGRLAAFGQLPILGIVAGRIGYRAGNETLPFYERSYLGGPANLRGVDFGSVRGDNCFLATLEIRRPVFLLPLDKERAVGFGFHAFHDRGAAWHYGSSFEEAPIRYSSGLGVHLNICTKNLRFEWARTDEGEDVFVFEDSFTF